MADDPLQDLGDHHGDIRLLVNAAEQLTELRLGEEEAEILVAVPVYRHARQIGRATTTTWSPTLKKLIALATIHSPYDAIETAVELEVTVDAVRHRVPTKVVETPFFNPARKTAMPALMAAT